MANRNKNLDIWDNVPGKKLSTIPKPPSPTKPKSVHIPLSPSTRQIHQAPQAPSIESANIYAECCIAEKEVLNLKNDYLKDIDNTKTEIDKWKKYLETGLHPNGIQATNPPKPKSKGYKTAEEEIIKCEEKITKINERINETNILIREAKNKTAEAKALMRAEVTTPKIKTIPDNKADTEPKNAINKEWETKKGELTLEMVKDYVLLNKPSVEMEKMAEKYGDLYKIELQKLTDKYKAELTSRVLRGEATPEEITFSEKLKSETPEGKKIKAEELIKKLLNFEITKDKLSKEDLELVERSEKEVLEKLKEDKTKKQAFEKDVEEKSKNIAKILNEKGENSELSDEYKMFLSDEKNTLNVSLKMKELSDVKVKEIEAKNEAEAKAKKEKEDADAVSKRQAFGAMDPAQKRAAAMERYQKIIDNKIKAIEETHGKGTAIAEAEIAKLRNTALEKRNGGFSEDEKYHGSNDRKMTRYNHNSETLRNILNNEQYKKLQKMDPEKMNYDQKKALEVFEKQKEDVKNNLKKIGPSGMDFVNLEEARAKLAKSSQEYSHSFKSKFFGSKVLAGITNMFGFKWSGIKEGEHTQHAKHEMHHAQEHYDKIRQQLMQNFVGEEHAVRKAWKQENTDIATGMEGLMRGVKREFINREYEKLDDLKHILEDSVKKPAFEKFAKWYKNSYWNWIKNERVRTVAKRLTNALFLGAVFAPFSLAAAGTVIGTKLVRAAISGVVGETAAAGVAGIFGGKKNAKGEFVRFADKRDAEFKKHEDEFVKTMLEQIRANENPNINPEIMNRLKTNHEGAIHQMQRRENRVRKGEMWARILAGGGTLYGLSQLDPDHVIIPGPNPEPIVIPNPNEINIEGNSVLANSKGFIQTFMDLKEKVVSEYANNPDYPQFKGLTHDQIADELGKTGQFDELTKEIMNAKSLDEFMDLAKEHGFWKPEGWNNSLIDSGSVPAGSRVGMEMAGGNMRLYVELPNGTHIPIDDNFNQALEKSLKGVTMIDSDHLGNRNANLNSNGLENTSTTTNPESLNGRYPDLNDFEEGPQLYPAPSSEEVEDALREVKTPEQIITQGGSMDQVKSGLEEIYQNRFNAVHGDYFKSHPMDLTSEKAIYESLVRNGHIVLVEGDQYTPMQTGDIEKIKFDRATAFIVDGEKYYLDSYTNLKPEYKILQKDLILAVDQDSRPITIQDYKEYQKLDHYKMVDEPYERYIRSQAEASTKVSQVSDNGNNQPGASRPSVENLRIQEEALLKQAGDAKYENWIDQSFGRDRMTIFGGGHVNGVDTNAWDRIKNDKIEDFLNDTKNADEIYSSAKEEDFFDKIREEVIKAKKAGYSVGIQKDETVAHFVDRLADISAKIDGVKRVASSR